jgi:hypothetical protein
MASPLVFTYNYPKSSELDNIFVNAPTSPLPGTSSTGLLSLQSPNLVLQGVTLTIQGYNNRVAPASVSSPTSVSVQNLTIIASSGTNTLGTLSYIREFPNPVPGKDPLLVRTRVAKLSSFVTSASGIFANYLFGNVITVVDNTTYNRTISIYSAQ